MNQLKLPDFFIIGAAKAGTTSIHSILSQHPGVFMPDKKEPEFFARDELYAQGIEVYSELFADAEADQILGEASTIYSLRRFFPNTAKRIAQHCPHAKIIYILRDPVERAYSYYVQLTKNYQNWSGDQRIHRSFEDFIFPERQQKAAPRSKAFAEFDKHLPDHTALCLEGSEYLSQIEQYLEFYPRERICVLKFEDYKTDRVTFFRKLTDFLELDVLPDSVLFSEQAVRNISREHFQKQSDLEMITRLKSRAGLLWRTRALLPGSLRAKARRIALRLLPSADQDTQPPAMEDATREILVRQFRKQDDVLEDLTGIRYY